MNQDIVKRLDLDDEFIELEEEVTDLIAHYVDEHLEQFVAVTK